MPITASLSRHFSVLLAESRAFKIAPGDFVAGMTNHFPVLIEWGSSVTGIFPGSISMLTQAIGRARTYSSIPQSMDECDGSRVLSGRKYTLKFLDRCDPIEYSVTLPSTRWLLSVTFRPSYRISVVQ